MLGNSTASVMLRSGHKCSTQQRLLRAGCRQFSGSGNINQNTGTEGVRSRVSDRRCEIYTLDDRWADVSAKCIDIQDGKKVVFSGRGDGKRRCYVKNITSYVKNITSYVKNFT